MRDSMPRVDIGKVQRKGQRVTPAPTHVSPGVHHSRFRGPLSASRATPRREARASPPRPSDYGAAPQWSVKDQLVRLFARPDADLVALGWTETAGTRELENISVSPARR